MKNFLLLLLFSLSAHAQNWTINKDHSQILFEIPYLQISEVTGRFSRFDGQGVYDEETKNFKNVTLTIDATTIDTGNKMRDGHLKSNDFLKTSIYPTIIFVSNDIRKLKGNQYEARGQLTIRNVTRNVNFQFTTSDPVTDTWGFQNVFVKFESKIDRRDFKILWNKTLPDSQYLVGDIITVRGNFQMQPMGAKTPTTKHMIPDTAGIREREKIMRGEGLPLPKDTKTPLPPATVTNETSKASEIVRDAPLTTAVKSESRSQMWWSFFAVLGLLGFVAAIMVASMSKHYLAAALHVKYVEGG